MSGELVLVTGGSGFIATHCIVQLLAAGYRVRTTVRSLKREPEVRALLKAAGADAGDKPGDRLAFFAADLTADAGWAEAAAGCDFVLHVASPFPLNVPKHEDELIMPAREGALRVLRASRGAGVRRVVQTSSFAAVGYGHAQMERAFNEHDWTIVDGPGLTAYAKSKTLAERAAWDFMAREGGDMELAVINPVGVVLLVRVLCHLYQGPVGASAMLAYGGVEGLYYARWRNAWPAVFAHIIWDIVPFLA